MVYSGSWSGAQSNSHLRLLKWGEKEGRIIRNFPGGIEGSAFLPGYSQNEFYFVYLPKTRKNELHIFNDKLEEIEVIDLDKEYSSLYSSIDIDGDEKKEFSLFEFESGKTIYFNHEFSPIAVSEPFKKLFQYKSFRSGGYDIFALTLNNELWQVSLQYNWARFKLPGILLVILLPWLLLIVLGIALRKYKRKPAKPAFQNHYLDHLSTGIIFIDQDNQVLFINRRARQLLEIEIPQMPVKLKIVIQNIPDELGSKLKKSITNPPGSSFEFSFGAGNNIRHLFFNVVSLTDQPGQSGGTLITIEDITKIVRSQRSIAFASLTQHLAHDIKNPLSNVRLVLERLKIDLQKLPQSFQGKLSQYLNSIEKDVNLVRNVTNSFMQFSNLSKPKKEPTDIHELIQSALSKRQPIIKDRIKFETDFIKEDILLDIDKEQITRAIDNILDNSIRAIAEKGTIILTTRITEHIIVETGLTENFFELEIEDSGKGIKPQFIDNIFEPFVSHSQGGTGLGLAIVKKIIEDHGGKVALRSKVGVGTRISILLPFVFGQDKQD